MSRPIITAVVRVACNNPDLLAHNRILEFAERVEEAVAAIVATETPRHPTDDADDHGSGGQPNFFRDATDTLLAGIVDDLLNLRRLVQVGPPFDRAELAAQMHTIGVNGEACWQYLHTYVEASSCAGSA